MNAIQDTERSCPSRFAMDRLLAGELDAERAAQLTMHTASCARCSALLAQLQRAHEAFAREALPGAVAERVRAGHRTAARLLWAAPLLAAAAALLVFGVWPASLPGAPSGERTKGSGVQFQFYVLHDGAVRPGADGERVQPGDRIEFAYSSEREVYLAIVSIDAAGKASVYYDEHGRAAKIPPGRRALLDRSTLLDATLGAELVYSLACAQPISVAPVREALERAPEAPPVVPGCAVERHTLHKVQR